MKGPADVTRHSGSIWKKIVNDFELVFYLFRHLLRCVPIFPSIYILIFSQIRKKFYGTSIFLLFLRNILISVTIVAMLTANPKARLINAA